MNESHELDHELDHMNDLVGFPTLFNLSLNLAITSA